MAIRRANLFAEKPPHLRRDEGLPDEGKMPDMVQRLVDLQEAGDVLKTINDGSKYMKVCMGEKHADHTDSNWQNYTDHSEYHEHGNAKADRIE